MSRAAMTGLVASRRALAASALAALAVLVLAGPASANPGLTTRESVNAAGAEANASSSINGAPKISADGLVTVFQSDATNLVPNDTVPVGFYTSGRDIFVRDRRAGTITQVSVASDGTRADRDSVGAEISADGRYAAFNSEATNLVAGDTNGAGDVFVHDVQAGTTVRVSVAGDGTEANNFSGEPSLSADGRFVAFQSGATNLVAGDANFAYDIFVHDRDTDTDGIFDEAGATSTSLVSVATDGTQSDGFSGDPAISADGSVVAFRSGASTFVAGDPGFPIDVFVRDRQTSTTTRVSEATDGTAGDAGSGDSIAISGDGTQVAYQSFATNLVAGDTNGSSDIFVRDRTASTTVRVSVASNGTEAIGYSSGASLSFDGRLVLFNSTASNLVANDTNFDFDVFVRDRTAGTTTLESVASDGTQGDSDSRGASISADGGRIAFRSDATNLVPDDIGFKTDIFVHRISTPPGTQALVVSKAGDGQGTVAITPGATTCGPACLQDFPVNTVVTLTPNPAAGSTFTGFAGACTGTAACTVTLGQASFVTATFDLVRRLLTVIKAGDGQGTVTSSLAGINCGADCAANYPEGTVVTLTARALPGFPSFTFVGFSGGGCSGSATTCTVTVDQARSVTATFQRTRRTLTVSKAGDGAGTVTSSPAGIDCGAVCSRDFVEGAKVTLIATPAAAFAGFSGACRGTGPCVVTMDRARSVTATFEDTSAGSGTPATAPPADLAPSVPVGPGAPSVPGAPAPASAPAPAGGGPVLSALSLSPASLRAARSGPSVGRAAGARVSYRLSKAGVVRFSVQRVVSGRRSQGRCVASSPSNRGAARCVRFVALRGSFTHRGSAGSNALRFTGRLAGRSLAAGRYRLVAVATDAAGNRSSLRRVNFRIVRR